MEKLIKKLIKNSPSGSYLNIKIETRHDNLENVEYWCETLYGAKLYKHKKCTSLKSAIVVCMADYNNNLENIEFNYIFLNVNM